MPLLTVPVLLTVTIAFIVGDAQSFVFDQCSHRHTNLTTQECVKKLILDSLGQASQDPERFFNVNELDNNGGTIRLIKLEYDNNGTVNIDQRYEMDESRSSNMGNFWEQLLHAFEKLTVYSKHHGILLSLPRWSTKYSPVSVIDEDDVDQGRGKHPHKKYALLFPLLATFKFLLIKLLLVPILLAVLLIKKILVVGVMALPAVFAMLRFCRNNNNFGFGPGNLVTAGAVGPIGQAAAFAPLTADLSGDYSSYVQQQATSQRNTAYKDYSKSLMDAA